MNNWLTLPKLIAYATILTALFFLISYGINIKRTYEQDKPYTYLAVLYFIGAVFFLLYDLFQSIHVFTTKKTVTSCDI